MFIPCATRRLSIRCSPSMCVISRFVPVVICTSRCSCLAKKLYNSVLCTKSNLHIRSTGLLHLLILWSYSMWHSHGTVFLATEEYNRYSSRQCVCAEEAEAFCMHEGKRTPLACDSLVCAAFDGWRSRITITKTSKRILQEIL